MIALAQQKTITGTVIDTRHEPVIGASVLEKGTSNGTITNLDGEYSLKVSPGATLVFSYIGYKTQEIRVSANTNINVTLAEDAEQLQEVVVVGYGVQKKSSLTGSVASVSSKEIVKQLSSNVASTLQGRTPGVDILQQAGVAGADVNIIIRGAASFGATEPLYVIDGAFSNSGLSSLNPNDIESIEVLKDGAAAAIYGSRAANGVVLITTKRGKSGKPVIEIDGSYAFQTPTNIPDFLNATQWREFANNVADNSGNVQPITSGAMSSSFSDSPSITKPGEAIGSFYGYKINGFDADGNFIFADTDNNGSVDANDKVILGNPIPDFSYGLNLTMSYKDFDLTMFFQGVQGNEIFNQKKYTYYFDYSNNCVTDVLNAWTKNNQNTNIPIMKTQNTDGGNSLPSEFYIEDGSYFRCKNLQLGYNFPKSILNKISFNKLRVYAGVQNLFTITNYSGYDPEVSSNALFSRGIDSASYPNARTFTFGFNASF
jgi:TonB-dependent SusC/RagA subfamily outer membrane receptor